MSEANSKAEAKKRKRKAPGFSDLRVSERQPKISKALNELLLRRSSSKAKDLPPEKSSSFARTKCTSPDQICLRYSDSFSSDETSSDSVSEGIFSQLSYYVALPLKPSSNLPLKPSSSFARTTSTSPGQISLRNSDPSSSEASESDSQSDREDVESRNFQRRTPLADTGPSCSVRPRPSCSVRPRPSSRDEPGQSGEDARQTRPRVDNVLEQIEQKLEQLERRLKQHVNKELPVPEMIKFGDHALTKEDLALCLVDSPLTTGRQLTDALMTKIFGHELAIKTLTGGPTPINQILKKPTKPQLSPSTVEDVIVYVCTKKGADVKSVRKWIQLLCTKSHKKVYNDGRREEKNKE